MKPFLFALTAALISAAAAPALAHHPADARRDAHDTRVAPLTYSLQADRLAAVGYMDDTLSLLEMASGHLRTGHRAAARRELLSASGKLTTSYLLMFQDRGYSDRVMPLVERTDAALGALEGDTLAAADAVSAVRKDLLGLYRQQLAQLGGGAGRSLEALEHHKR